jgi:hypothetical protein
MHPVAAVVLAHPVAVLAHPVAVKSVVVKSVVVN